MLQQKNGSFWGFKFLEFSAGLLHALQRENILKISNDICKQSPSLSLSLMTHESVLSSIFSYIFTLVTIRNDNILLLLYIANGDNK